MPAPHRSGSEDPAGAPSTGQSPGPDAFESLYKRLEDIVTRLEHGDLTLEDSLSLYEEGMTLARRCQEMLHNAELRITRLHDSFAESLGALREEPEEYELAEDPPGPEPPPG